MIAALGVASYWDATTYSLTVALASFAPYLMLAAVPALLGFLFGRHLIGAALSAAVIVLVVVTTVPLFVANGVPANSRDLRLLTLNARLGHADAATVKRLAKAEAADLVMVEELTPEMQQRLVYFGLSKVLPYRYSLPAADGVGTGLWSRYPLTEVRSLDLSLHSVVARVAVPGMSVAPTVVALHVTGPFPVATGWARDMARLQGLLKRMPTDAPVIVAGDFNATHSIGPFRALLDNGYADAGDQAGDGFLLTYPAGTPVIGIDHVLTRDAVGRSVRTVRIAGTDHRGLLATVALPRTS